jgi:chromosome segregation ATPase
MEANLKQRIKEAEDKFNELKVKREKLLEQGRILQRQISEVDQEQLRLQGEYRALQKLVNPEKPAKPVEK